MRSAFLRFAGQVGCAAAVLMLTVSSDASAPGVSKEKPSTHQSKTAAVQRPQTPPKPTLELASLPKSVFTIPASPADGRNPFFPNSSGPAPAPQQAKAAAAVVDLNVFVLNGITGPPLRSAMINGRTFLVGEEGEVRIPSGSKVFIRCAEIGDERAIIEVGGARRELKLRLGI